MKYSRLLYGTSFVLISFLFGCKAHIDQPQASKGTADFTKYVAIGNSLTAGYADGGLYREGQLNSYPAMIALQLKNLGSGAFVQPLFIPGQENGSGYLKLTGLSATGSPNLVPVTTDLAIRGVSPLSGLPLYTKFTDPVNNLGVPGIRLSDVFDVNYGYKNPFFERLETDAEIGVKSYTQKVVESQPTFFTCWLGNNDALQFATSGGVYPPLTPPSAFAQFYTGFLAQLAATKAKGVLATIPDVTLIPYFNTITVANILAQAPAGVSLYIQTGAGATRKATASDLITLTVDSIGVNSPTGPRGFSPYNPIPNKFVLDSAEVSLTRSTVASYNTTITQLAQAGGYGLMDVNQLLGKVALGSFVIDGVPLSLSFISGGVFSLDGVHLTPRGYAMVANQYIQAINSTYKSTVSPVNPALFRTVELP